MRLLEYRAISSLYTGCCGCEEGQACYNKGMNPCPKSYCPNTEGYPCKDQVNKMYFYNNRLDTNQANEVESWIAMRFSVSPYDYLINGRDYYSNSPYPNYTPYVYPHPLRKPPTPLKPKFAQ